MPSEYEDKYLSLRDENTALKKKKNEHEATIKRMYTKLAMIEEKLTKTRQGEKTNNQDDIDMGSNKAIVDTMQLNLDTKKFIAALKSDNVTLRKKNQTLVEKNRWLIEKCRRSSATKRRGGESQPTMQKRLGVSSIAKNEGFAGDLELTLKKRLVTAENQLIKLQTEISQLRTSSGQLQLKLRQYHNEEIESKDVEEQARIVNNKEPTSLKLDQSKRELKDRQAQLAILHARYENLESNVLAEREIQVKTLAQMDQMNRQVHKLRTQLQDAVMEKEDLEIRVLKASDHENDNKLLRQQNCRLEERMTSLCESPFINDAFQRKERIDKLCALDKLTQEQKTTINSLSEESQKHQGAMRELQSRIKQLKQAKYRVEQDLAQMTHHLKEERDARSLGSINLNTRSGSLSRPENSPSLHLRAPKPQYQTVEKQDACSSPVNYNVASDSKSGFFGGGMVSQKYEDNPITLDAIGKGKDNSVKHLRNRVHVLQIARLKALQELERCEKMLQAQTNINRELALEVEELTMSKISTSNQLQRQMKDLELLCEVRQQRILALQAEIRQLKNVRETMALKMQADDEGFDDANSGGETIDGASSSESLVLSAQDLAPGEQLLEVGIIGGDFESSVIGINSSTFILCDFYDFESQSTSIIMGSRPEYNLSATFKLTVDGFVLRYLASESIYFEVYQAARGDFKLIGKSSIRLSKLLQSKGVVREPRLAINSVTNIEGGLTVLGTLNIIIRLSLSFSKIWQVHLRSYPQDIKLLSISGKMRKTPFFLDALNSEDCDDNNSCSSNELQITVFACRKLRSYGNRIDGLVPSSYAHYQLLGFPDVFTNIVPESTSPEYDISCSQQAFALKVDACLLRFLSKFRLGITVFDDQADLDEKSQRNAMVGRCELLLSDLVHGETIRGWFPLTDHNDRHAGDISVLIQWKDPFQILYFMSSQRARGVSGPPVDMHSLNYDQQHVLLSMFSADMDGRVNYRQFLHYAAPSKELELLIAKIKERLEYAVNAELMTCVKDAIVAEIDEKDREQMLMPMEVFAQFGEKYGILLSDSERDLLQLIFGFKDNYTKSRSVVVLDVLEGREPREKYIAVNYLLLHINPHLSCSERLLCHKIRQTLRRYFEEQWKRKASDSVPAYQLFKEFDEATCGRITRSAFRKCLSALGFDLTNVESEYRELFQTHTKQFLPSAKLNDFITGKIAPPLQERVHSDKDIIEDKVVNVQQHPMRQVNLINEARMSLMKEKNVLALLDPSITTKSVPATVEFQRRKQAFQDRMKAVASGSSKSLVFEYKEKKLEDKRRQASEQELKESSRVEVQARQLHIPQNLHHEAARMLQRQYRHYTEHQQENHEKKPGKTNIIEAEFQLQIFLCEWSSADLSSLKDSILAEIGSDFPEATRTKLLTKKQLVYFLSKIPRVPLPPDLLWQIMDYFLAKDSGMVAYQSLLKFVFSTATEDRKREKSQRLSVLRRLFFDIGHASFVFMSAGDPKNSGLISVKNFHEGLSRLGVQLSLKELHLLTIMFDANGHEVLYHALLYVLTQLPHYQQLAVAIKRCQSLGVSLLREKLLTDVNSKEGFITQKELLQVLIPQSSERTRFETQDASLLFQMVIGSNDPTKRITIQDLCLRLEAATKYSRKPTTNDWNKYDAHHLQQLGWNCRKFVCGSFTELKYEFERFDWQKQGQLSWVTFVSIAHREGFSLLTEDQLKGIAKSFGVKTNNSFDINYLQFLNWTTPPPPVDMDAVEKKLRETAQEEANKLPSKQLSVVFANWNQIFLTESSKGIISRSNFVRICNTCINVPLDENEMRTLLYTYDPELNDQIDFRSFLRMNWRDAKITYQKQAEAIDAAAKAKVILSNISEKLQDKVNALEKIAKAFSYTKSTTDVCVDCEEFILAMRKLQIIVSPGEAQTLYFAFGEHPDKTKMDFVRFFDKVFGLHVPRSSKQNPDCQLSFKSERLLSHALEAATNDFFSEFQKSFIQFQEFCVLQRFAEINLSALWHQMEENGLVNILSKKAIGLLSQKFSTTVFDHDGNSSSIVSLKAIHMHLKNTLSGLPNKCSQKRQGLSESTELVTSEARSKAAINVLSDLVNSCDEHGVDFRAEFEAHDRLYTGYVTAMELKGILLRLDIGKYASDVSAEVVIGQIVRQFRSAKRTDSVHYTKMLYEATEPLWSSTDVRWFDKASEHLRSRIRLKSDLAGPIDHSDKTNYARLDAAFRHFDREGKGFLTAISVCDGLRALNYDLAPAQASMLMLNMCVFCHRGGGLSRSEFDSFVIDPYAAHLLKKIFNRLYFEQPGSQSQYKMPRVAYLSRLLMESGGHSNQSSILAEIFWTQLERALEGQITALEKRRLTHLFDVERNGTIAYKLFLKVMSQRHTTISVATPNFELERGPRFVEQQQEFFTEKREVEKRPMPLDILRSLYNQMSSIDFNSQQEIVEEYLRREDPRRSGSIEVEQLKRVFDRIGLCLSVTALTSLQLHFPGLSAKGDVGNLVAYKKVLLALEALHETSDDK